MSFTTHAHRNPIVRGALSGVSSGSTPVLGSIAVVLGVSLAIVASTPPALALPAIALAAAALAILAGLTAWLSNASWKPSALTCAGIFALVAMGACILGDPDQVALALK